MAARRLFDGLSLTEHAVLGLLQERPEYPFALARQLVSEGELGRVLTVRRPLVYRALGRLVAIGMAESHYTEPGDCGPQRTVHRITPEGRAELTRWLEEPVDHVRELRLEFLLKLAFMLRRGGPIARIVARQRSALRETIDVLRVLPDEPDVVDLWRYHQAVATLAFLDDLPRYIPY